MPKGVLHKDGASYEGLARMGPICLLTSPAPPPRTGLAIRTPAFLKHLVPQFTLGEGRERSP